MVEFLIRAIALIAGILIVVPFILFRVLPWTSLVLGVPFLLLGRPFVKRFFDDLSTHWFYESSIGTLYQLMNEHAAFFYGGSEIIERNFYAFNDQAKRAGPLITGKLTITLRIFNAVVHFGSKEVFKDLFTYAVLEGDTPSEWCEDIAQLKKLARYDPTTAQERATLLQDMLEALPGRSSERRADVLMDLGDALCDIHRHQSEIWLIMMPLWVDDSGHWLRHYGAFTNISSDQPFLQDTIPEVLTRAEECYRKAAKIYHQFDLFRKAALALDAIGDCCVIQGKGEAVEAYDASLHLLSQCDNSTIQRRYTTYKQAALFALAKDWTRAEQYTWQCLVHSESLYDKALTLAGKRAVAESLRNICGNGLTCLVQLLRDDHVTLETRQQLLVRMFHYLDTGKGRLVSEFAGYHTLSTPRLLGRTLLQREIDLLMDLRKDINQDVLFLMPESASEKAKRQNILEQLDHVWNQMFVLSKEAQTYVNIRRDIAIDIPDMPGIFRQLESKTGFLFVQALMDGVLCFFIRSDSTALRYHLADLSEGEYNSWKILDKKYLAEYRQEFLAEGRNRTTTRSGWRELGRKIINPFINDLHNLDLLYLVPDSHFSQFPLHTLWIDDQKTTLIDICPVAYTSSVRLLRKLLYRNEVVSIGETVTNATVLKGPKPRVSSDTNIKDHWLIDGIAQTAAKSLGVEPKLSHGFAMMGAQSSSILHMACHGSEDIHKPGIWLNDGGTKSSLYTVKEIRSLTLNKTDLVFLNVCLSRRPETAQLVAKYFDVTEAFLCAGTSSTISALWRIRTRPTQFLVSQFYKFLLDDERQKQISKARALQEAMLKLRELDQNVYTWGGFVLTGHYL